MFVIPKKVKHWHQSCNSFDLLQGQHSPLRGRSISSGGSFQSDQIQCRECFTRDLKYISAKILTLRDLVNVFVEFVKSFRRTG